MKEYKLTILQPHFYKIQANNLQEAVTMKEQTVAKLNSTGLDPKPFEHSLVEIVEEAPQTA